MTPELRQLHPDDIDAYLDHLSRHYAEPGFGGKHAHPHSLYQFYDGEHLRPRLAKLWSAPIGEGAWNRTWGLFDGQNIIGHIDINHGEQPVLSHRARLGMGLEFAYRGRGYGAKMLKTVIDWAKTLNFLEWLDLDVFAHNTPAIHLYQKFGFKLTGKVLDRIRVDDQQIEDWQMTLNLRASPKAHTSGPDTQLWNVQHLEHRLLKNKTEEFSASASLTDKLGFKAVFVHHEIIPPGRRASSPHFHSHLEEMFFVLKGHPTFVYGSQSIQAQPGDFIGFKPGERVLHHVENNASEEAEILGICSEHPLDETKYSVDMK